MESEANGKRLDSWKAIAVHLGRDVRTVQRWEKREGLPVHRLFHEQAGSVYAYTQEVDDWRKSRSDCRRPNIQQRFVSEREQLAVHALLEMILAHFIAQKADPASDPGRKRRLPSRQTLIFGRKHYFGKRSFGVAIRNKGVTCSTSPAS